MQELRQSTEMKVRVGSAVDATDGVSPETGLTLGAADQAELLKHNGAATADISGNTFAAVTAVDGWYDLTLTTTDTNTLGQLTVVIQDSSLMAPIFRDFMVVTANYWDSKYSTDVLQVDITQWLGTAVTANVAGQPTVDVTRIGASTQSLIDLKDFADACYDPTNNKVQSDLIYIHGSALSETAGQLAAGFTKLFDVATPLLVASDVMRGTDSAYTGTPPTAAAIVNEWETQSQADPTGFHVNVLEIGGTAQTANDNGADINAILTDTNELQTDWVNGGRLDLILDACALEATVAALNNISAADVNTQVSDVIKTDTISEMAQGVPAATPTLEDAIMYLYMYFRNEVTQTATTLSLKNDGGTVITKATVSDDATTFTKGEMVSGP